MLWYNLESLSWGFGHYSSTQTIPSWRTNSKGKIELGLGTSHSESEMKFSSMCCSSQHKQKNTKLWGFVGKGTENKMYLNRFDHLLKHWRYGRFVVWLQAEAWLPLSCLLSLCLHWEGEKMDKKGNLWAEIETEINYQLVLQIKQTQPVEN